MPTSEPASDAAAARAELHAPFRSTRGRRIAWSAAIGQAVIFVLVAVILPAHGPAAVAWYDRAGFILLAALIGWGLSRFATVAAVPSEQGVTVRNLIQTRQLSWAEVLGIRFQGGDPWVTLDISDGDTLAVMAIQRADGERSRAEAGRLATLIALHERSPHTSA